MSDEASADFQNLLAQGARLKDEGNKRFTAKHQQLDEARDSYLSALDKLPLLPPPSKAAIPAASGIQEVTDEEAEAIEAESHDQERQQRVAVENQIRECSKAVWGNLGAVYLVMVCAGSSRYTLTSCRRSRRKLLMRAPKVGVRVLQVSLPLAYANDVVQLSNLTLHTPKPCSAVRLQTNVLDPGLP